MPIFAGNVNLLVAAPMLQDFLIDKDGTPMSGGTVTCYHDNSRTTLKNWYYQTGTPGTYTYIALPNPLTLSAAGTICDINGVDTIPFFYPYSEQNDTVFDPYYITIVNNAQTNQITRANFPFVASSNQPTNTNTSFNNLIVNNEFWRNAQPNLVNVTPYQSINLSSKTSYTVAPSQHDGFSMPDIIFLKNNTSATDAVTFTPFPIGTTAVIKGYITPETYLNHQCSGAGSAETQKCYQFPIALHLNNLANNEFTVSIQAQNAGGTGAGQNTLSFYLLQFTGTGTSSPAPILIEQITLSTSWASYQVTSIFPSATGLTLGQGGDDAFYLQIQVPLNVTCSINFTKPSLYLTNNQIPFNDFQTYDEIDTIISSPRTGDIRTSLNSFYPYGWVPMNDGTIGFNPNSMATYLPTARNSVDTWPLYNLIWTLFKPYTGISSNPICPMINTSGSSIVYGASAYADFIANNSLTLTQMMGKVIMGSVPAAALTSSFTTTFTASNSGGNLLLTTANAVNYFNGMPVYVSGGSLPSTIGANTIYYVSGFSPSTSFFLSTSFANAIAGTVIAYAAGSGTVWSALAGTNTGEYQHLQLLAELVGHTHAATAGNFVISSGAAIGYTSGGSNLGTSALTAATGGNTAFNITQPGVFYNLYIKL